MSTSLRVYTWIHVAISLVAIAAGLVAVYGLLTGQLLAGWTLVFLATTAATSATGFGFPFEKLLPSHILGVISLVVLAVAAVALYWFHLDGAWRWIYIVSAVVSLYLNVFVLVVQAFQKVPPLKATAPTQSEPPFVVTQLATLTIFVLLTVKCIMRN